MDATDGGGEIDLDEFGQWFRSEAAQAGWASALLQCPHCAEYGLGFSCGGWTEQGYTAWNPKGARLPSRVPLFPLFVPLFPLFLLFVPLFPSTFPLFYSNLLQFCSV